mgnify:CR=1 FL=1
MFGQCTAQYFFCFKPRRPTVPIRKGSSAASDLYQRQARNTVVPAEKLSNVSGLIDIKSYYKDRYSGNQSNSAATNSNDTQGVSLDSTDDLFG